jgi:hypothetical protein
MLQSHAIGVLKKEGLKTLRKPLCQCVCVCVCVCACVCFCLYSMRMLVRIKEDIVSAVIVCRICLFVCTAVNSEAIRQLMQRASNQLGHVRRQGGVSASLLQHPIVSAFARRLHNSISPDRILRAVVNAAMKLRKKP